MVCLGGGKGCVMHVVFVFTEYANLYWRCGCSSNTIPITPYTSNTHPSHPHPHPFPPQDTSPVVPRGPPKSITVEDSFKSCDSPAAVTRVLHVLLPDLWTRLVEDGEEYGRWPGTLTVKWRHRGAGHQRQSASAAWPVAASPVVLAGRMDGGGECACVRFVGR